MEDIKISSPEFENNEYIPDKFGCKGENINPELKIENIPQEAKSLVLIMDDPDAPTGTFDHWILFNISPETKEIQENSVPESATQGKNDFGKTTYGGPCPPSGTHRYFFKIYALNDTLDLEEGSTKQQVEDSIEGKIISQNHIIGLYSKE